MPLFIASVYDSISIIYSTMLTQLHSTTPFLSLLSLKSSRWGSETWVWRSAWCGNGYARCEYFFSKMFCFSLNLFFYSSIVRIMPVSLTNIEERTYFVVSLSFPKVPSSFNLQITSSVVWLNLHMRNPFRLLLHPRNEETSSRSNGPPLRNGSGATTHR